MSFFDLDDFSIVCHQTVNLAFDGSGAKVCVLRIPYYNMQHKEGRAAHWLSCVACFELSAIVYADNDAVLTDYTNNLKIDSTTGGIYPFRQLRRARCGELDP